MRDRVVRQHRRGPRRAPGPARPASPTGRLPAARALMDRAAPATIRDVAERAGVSTATVSRVLAGIGNPKPETAAAVCAPSRSSATARRASPARCA